MPRKRKPLSDSPRRWKEIEKKYGLTREAYLSILAKQRGKCAICHRPPELIRPYRHLAVDHDHTTGRIRGLLCFVCNHKLLGWYIRDDVSKAKRLYDYLRKKHNYGKVPDR